MVEKLKSVLKIPKLRLGIKAVALALGLYFLPVWAAGILAALFYFMPSSVMNFGGTFIAFLILVGSFLLYSPALAGKFFIVLCASFLFFILLGIKNMIFAHRSLIFFCLAGAMTLIAIQGFFLGVVSLLTLALIIFLIYRDAFAIFAPFPGKASFLAMILVLCVAQLSWAVFYLNLAAWQASVAAFLAFTGIVYAIIRHLYGELFKSDAPFIAVACGIISFVFLILVAF